MHMCAIEAINGTKCTHLSDQFGDDEQFTINQAALLFTLCLIPISIDCCHMHMHIAIWYETWDSSACGRLWNDCTMQYITQRLNIVCNKITSVKWNSIFQYAYLSGLVIFNYYNICMAFYCMLYSLLCISQLVITQSDSPS